MMHGSGGAAAAPEDVVDAVLQASRALVAVAARSIAEVDDTLTLPQYRTLVVLGSRGPRTVGALAEDLGVHSSTATRMCDRLVRRELVTRQPSPESRREVLVSLSPTGQRILRHVTAARRRAIAAIVANVPDQDRRAMVSALTAFGDAAGEVPDQAWAWGWDAG
jgi:DNA-binding MarR family transcriptional regulator